VNLRVTFLWCFIGFLLFTAVAGAGAILWDDMPWSEEIIVSSILLTIHSLAALAGGFALQRGWTPAMVRPAMVLTGMSVTGWVAFTWALDAIGWQERETVMAFLTAISSLGGWLLHTPLMLAVPLKRMWTQAVRWITIASAVVFVFFLLTLSLISTLGDVYISWAGQAIGIPLLLAALGTVLVPLAGLLERLTREAAADSILREAVPVQLRCPRCGEEAVIRCSRPGRCPSCGLRILVRFEEPRCACGYLLYRLGSDTCPECGRTVPEQDRGARLATESSHEHHATDPSS
jgi:predicted RNA-binding Zn-ribbon protein involved in translation (DUF1610 family)